jgi:hypothetical protein
LLKVFDQTHKTVLFVTHAIEEAILLGDEVVVITWLIKPQENVGAARHALPQFGRELAVLYYRAPDEWKLRNGGIRGAIMKTLLATTLLLASIGVANAQFMPMPMPGMQQPRDPGYGPRGTVSTPNVFGGQNYSDGTVSTPNVFGGMNYQGPNGRMTTCTPNVFGGQNCF